MHLKHLTINGFKSFAKKSELEFSSSITAIVGPNGSGKSNVAESFRFVLGEQSPSRMRGKKGEDLIWGGSDQVGRSNRASVSVTLNNSNGHFPVDFEEIILERVVHRDGANEYLINGSAVRLKDVQELLAAANIGPSGHHIISQGEADRILSSNPKERREMIEDALGLKAYQFKKLEAERKLEKTRENIEKVESLRREVAPHLRFLEKQIKKIEKAVELRSSLRVAYADYLKREDHYLSKQQEKLLNEQRPLKKRLAELESSLLKARDALEAQKQDAKREALVLAESSLREARQKRQDLLRQTGSIEGQLIFLEKRIKAAKDHQAREQTAMVPYQEIERVVEGLEKDAEKAVKQEEVALLRRSLTDLVRTLRQFLNTVGRKVGGTDTGEEEKEYRELQTKKYALDKELGEATKSENAAEEKYQEIREKIEAEASEGREAERLMFEVVNERRECENALSRLEYEIAALERERDEFKREVQEAVVLIGRSATDYLSHPIDENCWKEDREHQRERRRALEKMKIRLEESGVANDDIEAEYKTVKERDDFLSRELLDLDQSVTKLEQLISELNEQLNERFTAGIEKISVEFGRFFTLMFGGGEAKLEKVKIASKRKRLIEEEDPAEDVTEVDEIPTLEGIEVNVKLPNKRVKGLDMLSGGERALTSIALIFAMSQVNPPLFIILDETDAALDEANSRRYGDMIEALSKKSQLILITHNRETMSRGGILYGVTMSGDGVSKLLSVKLEDALAVAK